MNLDRVVTRRKFFKTSDAGASAGEFSAFVFLIAAAAKAKEEWLLDISQAAVAV